MQPIKLLIVEDDAISQLLMKTMLSNYQLTLVDSGESAIEAAADNPDLIILDINLPGIDNYETCRRLRGMEPTRTTPIIFFSAYSALEDRLQAYGREQQHHAATDQRTTDTPPELQALMDSASDEGDGVELF